MDLEARPGGWSTIAMPEAKMVRVLFLVGWFASSAKLNLASSAFAFCMTLFAVTESLLGNHEGLRG